MGAATLILLPHDQVETGQSRDLNTMYVNRWIHLGFYENSDVLLMNEALLDQWVLSQSQRPW